MSLKENRSLNNTNYKMISVWQNLCISNKLLIFIGSTSFILTCMSIFTVNDLTNPSLLAIRSIMSSIFGYIFGGQIDLVIKPSQKANKFQLYLAGTIALGSLLITCCTIKVPVDQGNASLVEIRNLLFTSTGYIVSKAKNNDLETQLDELCSEKGNQKNSTDEDNSFLGDGI